MREVKILNLLIRYIILISLLFIPVIILFAGEEFQVNTYIEKHQMDPSIATDAEGNFVITWDSELQDDKYWSGIFAQRFDKTKNRIGNEFHVNTFTDKVQAYPSVAMTASGEFIISWTSYYQTKDQVSIYAQRYDNQGNPVGDEFEVDTKGYRNDYSDIAIDDDGNFVITWTSIYSEGYSDVYAYCFDSNGNKIDDEFLVNTETSYMQQYPAISMDGKGNFIIVWESFPNYYPPDENRWDIFAQRFDKYGNKMGDEFLVNTNQVGSQRLPDIVMDADGNFVIVWNGIVYLPDNSHHWDVFAQRYDKDGNRIDGEFRVNSYNIENQFDPSIAMNNNGDFVITWDSFNPNGSDYDIYAKKYDKFGYQLGNEFLVNTHAQDIQATPSIALAENNNFVIAWNSQFQDGSGYGVFARLFENEFDSYINFELGIQPEDQLIFTDGDKITLTIDLKTPPTENSADIYLAFLNPDKKLYFGLEWSTTINPALSNLAFPPDFHQSDITLMEFKIPTEKPSIYDPGTYTFAIVAAKHDKMGFISNISTVSFTVE